MHPLLTHLSGPGPSSGEPDEGRSGLEPGVWSVLEERLRPVIGASGFRALAVRGVARASRRHHELADFRVPSTPSPPSHWLKRRFDEVPEERREAALTDALTCVLDNLEALVGRDLAARLLAPPPREDSNVKLAGGADE